jgi:phosphohistidine swiveling domain-containing protein
MMDKDYLLKRRWYAQSFNATPVLIHIGGMSIPIMKRELGYTYRHFLYHFSNDMCEMNYDREDLHDIAHEIEDRLELDRNYVKKIYSIWLRNNKSFKSLFRKNITGSKKMTDDELVESYKTITKGYYESVALSHMIECYALTRDKRLRSLLLKELELKGVQDKFNEYFMILTEPIEKSFINNYNNTLFELFSLLKEGTPEEDEKIKTIIKKLEDEFYWIRANYCDAKSLKGEAFLEEAKNMIKENTSLKVITDATFKENLAKKDELIKTLKLHKTLVNIVRLTDFFTNWQDLRKDFILKGCCAMEEYMCVLSKRFNVDVHYLKYILPEEITAEKLRTLPNEFYEARIRGCFLIYEGDELNILTGKEHDDFMQKMKVHEDGEESKEVHGMCASVGKAVGKVKICRSLEDINSFMKGDVLVTGMTRPEFVPAMQKAVAIVTDEGGITSHASVISRELGVPCVIGTKIATKMLKDGMLVEVNANHGIIKVIG